MGERSRNISVSVRVRPLVESERRRGADGAVAAWAVDSHHQDRLVDQRTGEAYIFDHVFGPATTTAELFEASGCEVIESFCEGVNGTIFAYGQTASGKTFTMQGNGKTDGIIQLAVMEIFNQINAHRDHMYMMKVSYMEIYNEQVFDLLNEYGDEVKVLDDLQGQLELRNLTWRQVKTGPQDIIGCLEEGDRRRHKGETKMNEISSR
ncbi:unnamed protein product, partial [Polarella glacialis]